MANFRTHYRRLINNLCEIETYTLDTEPACLPAIYGRKSAIIDDDEYSFIEWDLQRWHDRAYH